jgi:hypothetical protein
MARIVRLPRAFPGRDGVPVIARVDTRIFTHRYFTHCLQCGFCHDWCCSYGVDVELPRAEAILAHADALEAYTGIGRERWFEDEIEEDAKVPGGAARRTRVEDGACVFLRRNGRGCQIHAFCVERGIDYHRLKSIVDCLFPVTFAGDLLCAADEVLDGDLVCVNQGPSLFRGVEPELRYYFGDGLIEALAAVEARGPGRA